MQKQITQSPKSTVPSFAMETLTCRDAAMDRYSRLVARGYFPILYETSDGRFCVGLPPEELA